MVHMRDILPRDPADDLVDRAEAGVEHERPGRSETMGETTGSTRRAMKTCLPGSFVDEQLRHGEPQHQLERQRDRGEDDRVQQRLPQALIVEQMREACAVPRSRFRSRSS
jgi:hypothetical protein